MKKTLLVFGASALLFTGCNKSTPATETVATEEVAVEETATDGAITITAGDDMKFDLAEIKVKEGQTVKLTLNNIGQSPKSAMGHNFVLLAAGVSLEEFATEAVNAAATDYIPKGKEKEVIAHTKTLGGGESDTIEFPAPAKGTYDFLCSFPGHSALMKGKFIVE